MVTQEAAKLQNAIFVDLVRVGWFMTMSTRAQDDVS